MLSAITRNDQIYFNVLVIQNRTMNGNELCFS